MMNPNRAPDVGTSLDAHFEAMASEIHTAIPARIEKYDAARQLADVKPTLIQVFADDEGKDMPVEHPVLTDCPVAFPQGGGAFLSFPLKPGDTVLLVCAQRSLDAWLETDGKTPIDPGDYRRHHISDAVVYPGLRTAKAPLPNAHADDVVLGLTDGSAELHIEPGGHTWLKSPKMMLGSKDAAKALALAAQADARLDALESEMSSHVHLNGNFGGPTGALLVPFVAGGSPPGGSTASSKVFTDS